MARASATAENNALGGLVAAASFFGLNSTDPGTTGAAEISGGSPAYARVGITWGSPGSGSVANITSALVSNVPASTTVAFFSTWSLVTAGVYQIGGALNTSVTFNSQGTFTVAVGGLTLTAS
jgi:hypothetical protein